MNRSQIADELVMLMIERIPRECCGFIVYETGTTVTEMVIREVDNVAANPNVLFSMHPAQAKAIQARDLIVAVWHSHPHGPNYPSEPDRKWKPPNDWEYLLVTIEGVSEWKDTGSGWEKVRDWGVG